MQGLNAPVLQTIGGQTMRKAILPLLIIITMVLSASVATARDFAATGFIDEANGWDTDGEWINQAKENGELACAFTESAATASHPVATGASGQFDYMVSFRITDASNEVKIGLLAGGHDYAIEYKNGKFWFDGAVIGTNSATATATHYAHIWSEDGNLWHAKIYGYQTDVAVNATPTAVILGLKDNSVNSLKSPVIFTLNYESPGEPAVPPANEPATPAAAAAGAPPVSVAEIQDFYDNIYPTLYGPQANFGLTATPASITTGFTVSGSVTSAADGSPIADASVTLGDKLQKTDGLGKFKFEGIANGNADVAVSADGFASQTRNVDVNADQLLTFILDKAVAGGSTVAGAANETDNATMPGNATMAPTMAPTTVPSPTQTKSPGFEGIVAAIAMIGAAGILVYMSRKR